MSNPLCPRRRFLAVVAQGGALCGAASLGLGCGGLSLSGTYPAGNVSQLPVDTLQAVTGEPLAIGRDSGGVYAMTLVCTHDGCDIATDGTVSFQGVTCSCHGSRFDANGNVLQGPAQSPLQHYQVAIDASGAITVDASVSVVETTRTAVPA
jgi:nitrite reductase/ring-hydroxylating ferredoxin subunit